LHSSPAAVVIERGRRWPFGGSHHQGHGLAPSGSRGRFLRLRLAIYGSQQRKHSAPCSHIRDRRATRSPRDRKEEQRHGKGLYGTIFERLTEAALLA